MGDTLSDGALADLGTRQLRDTFGLFSRLAGGQVVESGEVFSYATGLPAFMANGAIVTGPATPDELRQSLDWVENSAELFLVTIDDRFLEPLVAALSERDMRPDEDPAPGMVLDPIPDLTDVPAGIEIEPVSASNYEAFASIIGAIFAPAETVRVIFPLNMVTGDHVRVMMASLDGEFDLDAARHWVIPGDRVRGPCPARSLPLRVGRDDPFGDPCTSRCASQLVDGRENLRRFRRR